jgi:hypothetical protein
VITTAPKSKAKPSVQTQFMLSAMAEEKKKDKQRWEQMQTNVDLLFVKLEKQSGVQTQMAAQLELTTQAITQYSKDHFMLTQQMATTSDLVFRLAVEWPRDPDPGDSGRHNDGPASHRQADPCPPHNHTVGGHRPEDEVLYNRHSRSKLSFPKFDGENPRIWIDKCFDYFKIFNIPECLWTTATSMHMEENAAKWL